MTRFLLLPLLGLTLPLVAQTVSVEQALERAEAFYGISPRQGAARDGATVSQQLTLSYEGRLDGKTCYYVFNHADDGFVIMGGDECAHSVLGYADEGTFDFDRLPDGLRYWLDFCAHQIADASSADSQGVDAPIAASAMAGRSAITPLLGNIKWGQGDPFNLAIDNGLGFFKTGCVATATAQLMMYHKWPAHDVDMNYDQLELLAADGNTYIAPAIRSSYTYHWNRMQDVYPVELFYRLTDSNVTDMAQLLYRVGRTVDMDYGSGSSGAHSYKVGRALIDHFGYDAGVSIHQRSLYSDQGWEQLIYDELRQQRPVYYSATADIRNTGHAFILDGYDGQGLYHVNWGWSGYCDGYYLVTPTDTERALCPNGSGTGGAGDGAAYTVDQAIIVGLQRDKGGVTPLNYVAEDLSLEESTVELGGKVKIMGRLGCMSYRTAPSNFSLKFVDEKNASKVFYSIGVTLQDMSIYQRYTYYTVAMPGEMEVGHTYNVYPVYRNDGWDWQEFQRNPDIAAPKLTVKSPTQLYIERQDEQPPYGLVDMNTWTYSFTLHNPTSSKITTQVNVYYFDSETVDYVGGICTRNLTIEAGGSLSLTHKMADVASKLQEGKSYYLYLNETNVGYFPGYLKLTVGKAKEITATCTSGWTTVCLPYDAQLPDGWNAYRVTGISRDGSAINTAVVGEGLLQRNTPYLVQGTGSHKFRGVSNTSGTYRSGILEGTTEEQTNYAPVGSYLLKTSGGKTGFFKVKQSYSEYVRTYTAMLLLPDGVTAGDFISLEGGEGIDNVTLDDVPTDASTLYDLQGRAVASGTRGLRISNHRLEFIK